MSTLREHLERLEVWLRAPGDTPPWTAIRLVESDSIEHGQVTRVPRARLHTIEEYAPRFATLLASGYSWINLSALGLFEDQLLVCVELPREGVGCGRTSVNISGPRIDATTGLPRWDGSFQLTG
jgi:hypothetical protein